MPFLNEGQVDIPPDGGRHAFPADKLEVRAAVLQGFLFADDGLGIVCAVLHDQQARGKLDSQRRTGDIQILLALRWVTAGFLCELGITLDWEDYTGTPMVEEAGFEPAYAKRTDLQSVSFNHSDTPPNASAVPDSLFQAIPETGRNTCVTACGGLCRPASFLSTSQMRFGEICCILSRSTR